MVVLNLWGVLFLMGLGSLLTLHIQYLMNGKRVKRRKRR